MGLLSMFAGDDINEGVEEFRETEGAILLDVRTPAECRHGVIPGSVNVPLDSIREIPRAVPDKSTPIFVYCLSGARSGTAAKTLTELGYTNVKNIGGISRFVGDLE